MSEGKKSRRVVKQKTYSFSSLQLVFTDAKKIKFTESGLLLLNMRGQRERIEHERINFVAERHDGTYFVSHYAYVLYGSVPLPEPRIKTLGGRSYSIFKSSSGDMTVRRIYPTRNVKETQE